jgi:hypothetical protein
MSNGQICVLYSPLTSLNGAKLPMSKGPAKKATVEDMSYALAAPNIITPHALPMFRDGEGIARGTKRKLEKARMDPRKSRRPELPVTGPGRGGRVGASATQHVVQNLVRDTTRDEDVRWTLFSPPVSLSSGAQARRSLFHISAIISAGSRASSWRLAALFASLAILVSLITTDIQTGRSLEKRCSSMRRRKGTRHGQQVSALLPHLTILGRRRRGQAWGA